jgi:hypothetical protein
MFVCLLRRGIRHLAIVRWSGKNLARLPKACCEGLKEMQWRLWLFNATLLALLSLSVKPLWWLPCLSLAAFLWLVPSRRRPPFDWGDWHPVWATLVTTPFAKGLSRWVRHHKIIGGDSLTLISTPQGAAAVLLDLSKNDLETFLHFVWVRALLATLHGRPIATVRKILASLPSLSDRVGITYLMGKFLGREVQWESVGCFGIGWWTPVSQQTRILPTLAKTFWRTRKVVGWIVTTDGAAPHLPSLLHALRINGTVHDGLIRSIAQDDLTVVWIAPALKFCPPNAISPIKGQEALKDASSIADARGAEILAH